MSYENGTFKRVGNNDQLVSVRRFRLDGGPGHGLLCISVEAGNGLSVTLVPDRGLDIYQVRYKGVNINYITPDGLTALEHRGFVDRRVDTGNFLGMLTTCGLDNAGPTSLDQGRYYFQHGRLATIAVDDLSVSRDDEAVIVSARTVEYATGDYSFVRRRKITIGCADIAFIMVEDEVENASGQPQQICLMYHYNFGFPFLDESLKLSIPSRSCRYKGSDDPVDMEDLLKVYPPDASWKAEVTYHVAASEEINTVRLENRNAAIGVDLSFDGKSLPCFDIWRMFKEREYVLAIEPCNAFPYGRAAQREKGNAEFLDPYSRKKFVTALEFSVLPR